MTTTPIHIVDKRYAVQYTGTNSTDIDALITQFDIVSESAGTLQFTSASSNFTANSTTAPWIIYFQGMVYATYSQADFDNFFSCNPVCADLAAVQQDIADIETTLSTLASATVYSVGVAPVPTLLLNQTATVQVTMTPALPDATYSAYSKMFAGVSLTGVQINSTTVVSTTRVDVVVQNTGLASIAGVNVMVWAIDA